ncbi:ABC transporter ATP-binding protein [Alteromonas oceanisediminis]|uniref:ABC transporter ATP-binding protein n=1 Tax=Alteromonas oceanisediminis TaxID=2836180 RepID=UPI001BD92C7C|nr:ATP-binding cassette domain-containing protein [Alteromonas oceanisediminis]MBT0585950.1 ATP-binding cassette domain-containing protein [Alteromonas oceanisediminis]
MTQSTLQSDATHPAIQLSNVEFRYPQADARGTTLHFSQWQVDQGKHVFLHGNSGSGKSTLLNLLCGILMPDSGLIKLFGTALETLPAKQRDRFRATNIGVVFQQFNLIRYLSVMQNVELARYLANQKTHNLKCDVESLLDSLMLPKRLLTVPVSSLSVGQQQRVAIMRAFVNKPRLLLIDEPTSALDVSARDAFMQHLMVLCNQNDTTLVFVSHDPSLRDSFSHHTPLQSFCTIVHEEREQAC